MDLSIVDDLVEEQRVLDLLVSGLTEDRWRTQTPAEGWTVADQIAHLAMFDDVAESCLTGAGEARFASLYQSMAAGDTGFIDRPAGDEAGAAVLQRWRSARAAEVAAFRGIGPAERVPWGPNKMAAVSLCTARLMETYAHGLDCFAALGVEPIDTDRLRHVCHITYRSIPNALAEAGLAMPAPISDLVVEVSSPTGETWLFGNADAPNRIEGTAGEFARVGVRRKKLDDAPSLRSTGPLASLALSHLKAYL